jgi:hypothetical protein
MTEGPLKDVPVDKAAFNKAVIYYFDIMGWPDGVLSGRQAW